MSVQNRLQTELIVDREDMQMTKIHQEFSSVSEDIKQCL
jgi:hypothetical protein